MAYKQDAQPQLVGLALVEAVQPEWVAMEVEAGLKSVTLVFACSAWQIRSNGSSG